MILLCSLIDRDDIIHTLTQPIITHIGCTMYTLSVIICTTTEYPSGGGGGYCFIRLCDSALRDVGCGDVEVHYSESDVKPQKYVYVVSFDT